ncbi:MAG: 30S ribosomal protein S13 [Thermoplasmata archaeon]
MAEKEAPEDFKYIVRIAATDVDGNRPVGLALTGVKGIGVRMAEMLADLAEVPRTEKIGNLSDDQVEALAGLLEDLEERLPPWTLNRRADYWTGEDGQLVGAEVDLRRTDDINRLKMIRSYRGIRHETGAKKVRGQRTKNNGRKGLQVGVTRKAGKGGPSG